MSEEPGSEVDMLELRAVHESDQRIIAKLVKERDDRVAVNKWRKRARHWKRVAEGWRKIYDEETKDLYESEREMRPPSETYRLQVKALEADRARVQFLFQRAGFAGVDPRTNAPAVIVTLAKWNELGEAIAGAPSAQKSEEP